MKFLFLLIIIACGKEKNPAPIDFNDSDGDQVLNYLEDGSNKYVANVEVLKEIKGVIILQHQNKVLQELSFTTQEDLHKKTLSLLTNRKKVQTEFFEEWNTLKFQGVPVSEDSKLVNVTITQAATDTRPYKLYFVSNKEKFTVSDWSSRMKFDLTPAQVNALVTGNAKLLFTSAWMEKESILAEKATAELDIKNKTYQVYYKDENETKIYYVARDHAFDDFRTSKGAQDAIDIDQTDLMKKENVGKEKQWWMKDIDKKKKVLVYSTFSELSESYKSSLIKTDSNVVRQDGRIIQESVIFKNTDSLVYLKLRGYRSIRQFASHVEHKDYRSGGGGREGNIEVWSCAYTYRTVQAEPKYPLSLDSVRASIKIEDESGPLEATQIYEYISAKDESGEYLMLGIQTHGKSLKVSLLSAPITYQDVGRIAVSCDNNYGRREKVAYQPMSDEARVEIKVEAFVEDL